MTRAQRFTVVACIFSALYISAYLSILPVPLLEDEAKNEILSVVCETAELVRFARSTRRFRGGCLYHLDHTLYGPLVGAW